MNPELAKQAQCMEQEFAGLQAKLAERDAEIAELDAEIERLKTELLKHRWTDYTQIKTSGPYEVAMGPRVCVVSEPGEFKITCDGVELEITGDN